MNRAPPALPLAIIDLPTPMSLISPFHNRLNANYVAGPEDESAIRRVIETQEAIVLALKHEVNEIQEEMMAPDIIEGETTSLEKRRKELLSRANEHVKFIKRHRLLLCSIHHIPTDVLVSIFLYLKPLVDQWSLDLGTLHPIVSLSHVCRHWRATAMSTPLLWSTLSIPRLPLCERGGYPRFEAKMRQLTNMVSTFVSLANGCPLTLNFVADAYLRPSDFERHGKALEPLVDALFRARWAELTMCIRFYQPSPQLKRLLQLPLQSEDTLRTAKIRLLSEQTSPTGPPGIDFHNAMKLSSLDVCWDGGTTVQIQVNWPLLTDLKLRFDVPVGEVSSILGPCVNLARCTIHLESKWTYEQGPPVPLSPITLPSLHTLEIVGYQEDRRFARSFRLPSLRTLSILDKRYSFEPPYDVALPEWIRLYGYQLEEMTFSYGRLSVPVLLSCLEALPNVRVLDIQSFIRISPFTKLAFDRAGLLALTAVGNRNPQSGTGGGSLNACSCPKLESIRIHRPDGEIKAEDWAAFVSSRRRSESEDGVAYIKRVYISLLDMHSTASSVAELSASGVQPALEAMGVSTDGVVFRFPPIQRGFLI